MNAESIDSLEAELRRLRPAAPGPCLARAIERALAAPTDDAQLLPDRARTRRFPVLLAASWGITAIAAAIVLVLMIRGATPGPPTTASNHPAGAPVVAAESRGAAYALMPTQSVGYLVDARDEGVVFLGDGIPARQVRYQFIDTFELRAKAGGGSVRVSYPRDEIRVVPISTY
jgi:hypothetical protein